MLEMLRRRVGDFGRASGIPVAAFCDGSSVSPAPAVVSSVIGDMPASRPPVLGVTAAAL